MGEIWTAVATGAAAGLGVAMPLGAVAALLLREGLVGGFRPAAAAAAGIATVDLLYCAAATATGSLFARLIADHRSAFLTASGVVIIVIGARQLRVASRPVTGSATGDGRKPAGAAAAYGRFVGLTAINPMTLVYFVALGGAVAGPDAGRGAAVAFVAAAGLASLAWQLGLAAAGAFFGRVIGARSIRAIGVGASVVVVGLGVGLITNGLGQLGRAAA